MKYRHLVRKDTKEFVSLMTFNGVTNAFTSSLPSMPLNNNSDDEIMDYLKRENPEIDFTAYELILIDVNESSKIDAIGEDIRNKLTPIKNLIALLNEYNHNDDFLIKNKIMKLINSEIASSKHCVEYLSNIM